MAVVAIQAVAVSDAAAGPRAVHEEAALGASTAVEVDGSLAAYVERALQTHPVLVAAGERIAAAEARSPQLTTLESPQLRYTWFARPLETRTGPQRHRLGVTQRLPWFGVLGRRGDVVSHEVGRARAELAALAVELQRQVKNAYHEYAWLAEEVRVTRDNLELLMQIEPTVQRKIQVGASQSDLLRLQMEIGRIEDRLESLERRGSVLSADLAAAVGLTPTATLPQPRLVVPEPDDLDIDVLHEVVAERNRDLEMLDQELGREAARVESSRLDDRPHLALSFDWFETGPARAPNVPGSGDDPFAISAQVTLPIWRAGYSAAINESLARQGDLLERRVDRQNQLRARTERVYFELDDAARKMALHSDTLIPRAHQTLVLTERAYQVGSASILDWLDAERELLEFDRSLHRAAADYLERRADLEALCGGLLP